ncbi:hypothetical protein Hdeb2414_s0004g00125341 [Helianthus debilis subsp. tardiflorus]
MLSRLKEAGDWLPSHHHGGTETLPSSTSSPSTLRSMTPPPIKISVRPTFHPRQALSSTDVQRFCYFPFIIQKYIEILAS